jgi:hypothetical protein
VTSVTSTNYASQPWKATINGDKLTRHPCR